MNIRNISIAGANHVVVVLFVRWCAWCAVLCCAVFLFNDFLQRVSYSHYESTEFDYRKIQILKYIKWIITNDFLFAFIVSPLSSLNGFLSLLFFVGNQIESLSVCRLIEIFLPLVRRQQQPRRHIICICQIWIGFFFHALKMCKTAKSEKPVANAQQNGTNHTYTHILIYICTLKKNSRKSHKSLNTVQ